ncbi:hypothetical protein JOM56_010064 [Amanita muscaria]
MTTHQRKPYSGTEKSLVIGIDVGTTLSGVSYAVLEPGKVPRINPVVRFSGQREERPDSKVPSVVCYDQDGHVLAAGPETDYELNPILSEIEGVRRAEWFKLRLRPPHLDANKRAQLEKFWSPPEPSEEIVDAEKSEEDEEENRLLMEIDALLEEPYDSTNTNNKNIPLPVTDDFKTAVQVFADFLQYLFRSAKEYIMETERYIDPTFTWSSIERNTYFVLTHPNGWEGKQQSQMREAAVAAGLVDGSTAADRITFVTEGEAGLHFCLDKNPELYQESGGLLVADCGGGTIDLSAYSQTEKGHYKEIVSPDCLLQGSVFVTSRARDYFKGKFKDSQFGDDYDVEAMASAFDKPEGAKCMFRNPTTPYFVKFGGLRDSDRKYGITNGKFKVEGPQVAKFFEPAVQDIIAGIINQCRNTKDGVSIKYVLLVGGFGTSDYLYERLRDYFKSSGIVVLRPDNAHLNKAAADGSVSWYLDCATRRFLESMTKLLIRHADRLTKQPDFHAIDHFVPEFGNLINRNPLAIEDWEQTLDPLLNVLNKLLVSSKIGFLKDKYCQECRFFQITYDTLTHFRSSRQREDPDVEKYLKLLEEIIRYGDAGNFDMNFNGVVFGSAAIVGFIMAILAHQR